jgi:hypothetical protein
MRNIKCYKVLDNIFIPEPPEKHGTKNKAVQKDIDEWIEGAESLEWFIPEQGSCRLLDAQELRPYIIHSFPPGQI